MVLRELSASVGNTGSGMVMAKYSVMKAATTTTAGPAMIIQTMPKDHQGLGLPFEVKVLVYMGDSLSNFIALQKFYRGIKKTDFSSNFSCS
jgi:hypothetical protein